MLCCTSGVGVCVAVHYVCICVVQCDGTNMYGIIYPFLFLLRDEVVYSRDTLVAIEG